MTGATLFTGFGGSAIGMQNAGISPIWGLELDPQIAEVCEFNLKHEVKVGDILEADSKDFEQVDALHASPPCPNFSQAKTDAKETKLDIALAEKVAEFITVLEPQIFTLENVTMYRHSQSWAIIQNALHNDGFWVSAESVNAADFGVPQSRRRMIVRAIKGGFLSELPPAVPHVGWYEAIEDLIPELEEKIKVTEKEKLFWSRVPFGDYLVNTQDRLEKDVFGHAESQAPAFTIRASQKTASVIVQIADKKYLSSTRCLARFQTFPDWFELPDKKTLACKGIGNAEPPLLKQRIYEGLL